MAWTYDCLYSQTPFLRLYQVLTASWLNHVFATFFNMFKVQPRPARPLRPYHVLIGFYCVPTSMYKVLLRPPNFWGGYVILAFHFSEVHRRMNAMGDEQSKCHTNSASLVHRSMNAMGDEQSKCHTKSATLTLHRTHCIHTSMNLRENENSFFVFTFVYNRSTH